MDHTCDLFFADTLAANSANREMLEKVNYQLKLVRCESLNDKENDN